MSIQILSESDLVIRKRTVDFIRGLSEEELDLFFMVNPDFPEEDGALSYPDEEFWDYQLEMYFGENYYQFSWDYKIFDKCYKELQKKTYKQRIERYLGIASDNGWQVAHRNWRRAVFERDGYVCQKCGTNKNLQAHHIKPRADYPDLQFDIKNGITLCKKCHEAIHNKTTFENERRLV